MVVKLIFWFILGLLVYTYAGYTLVLLLLNLSRVFLPEKPNPDIDIDKLPNVTILIASFNEIEHIETKIKNNRDLDYPEEKLKIQSAFG